MKGRKKFKKMSKRSRRLTVAAAPKHKKTPLPAASGSLRSARKVLCWKKGKTSLSSSFNFRSIYFGAEKKKLEFPTEVFSRGSHNTNCIMKLLCAYLFLSLSLCVDSCLGGSFGRGSAVAPLIPLRSSPSPLLGEGGAKFALQEERIADEGDLIEGTSSALGAAGAAGASLVSVVPRGGAIEMNDFAAKLLVSALVTLVFELFCGHMCEFLKILRMTTGLPYATLVKNITRDKGVLGLWDGFFPWGVFQSIGKGGAFGLAHAIILPQLVKLHNDGYFSMKVASVMGGGLAGGVQGYVLSPLLLLKTRVMTDPVFREKMSLFDTVIKSFSVGAKVVTKEGPMALMKGSNVYALKRVFDWSSRYWLAEVIESVAVSASSTGSLTDLQKMSCVLSGGALSSVLTLPLDTLVAKIQDAKAAGVPMNPAEMISSEYSKGGVKGLWNAYMKGWEARTVHVALTTVAMKSWCPLVYDVLFKKGQTA